MRDFLERWERVGTISTFGIWSYLAVGLLFGLTLPGVSAHGFLGGGGLGKGLYSLNKNPKGILRERLDRKQEQWTERKDRSWRSNRSEIGREETEKWTDREMEAQRDSMSFQMLIYVPRWSHTQVIQSLWSCLSHHHSWQRFGGFSWGPWAFGYTQDS